MRSRLDILSAIALTLAVASPVWAHHSVSGQFDTTKPIVLKGTVSKVDWMNPHVYIYLDVKEADGSVTTWATRAPPFEDRERDGRGTKHARCQSK